jgi:hypothetical protein
MKVPAWGRCTFCHSYQPRIILECQVEPDDGGYTRLFRFFCNAACHANWGTNQVRPPADRGKRVVKRPAKRASTVGVQVGLGLEGTTPRRDQSKGC